MNSERLLFVGVGQCGNNIVSELESKGYKTFAINTSDLDLKTVDVSNKYAIPGASGCARDRKKAIGYLKSNYNKIVKEIENKFDDQDIVYIVFSLGGGTGSGISPILLDILSRKYPNKKFGAIAVVASESESIQTKANTIEAYTELVKINNLRSIFLLDNNSKKNKLDINTEFVNYFDTILKLDKPNKNGVIDESEIEKLITCKGTSVIVKLACKENSLDIGESNTIFLDYEKGCKYMGVSLSSDLDTSVLENEFGTPSDVFKGYNNTDNIVIISGMGYPSAYFKRLDKIIDDFTKQSKIEVKTSIEIDTSKYANINKEINLDTEIDFDSLYNKYLKSK